MKNLKTLKILIVAIPLAILGCNKDSKESAESPSGTTSRTAQELEVGEDGLSKQTATLRVVHGKIKLAFYPKKAPVTVTRIMELISQGFYNDIIFHRVVPGFVAQAGDPTGTGTSGSGKNLPAEFNDLNHVRGTIAMARTQDPNSADSQFYITLSRQSHLDGKYTIFAKVIDGLDVIDKIQRGDKIVSFTLD